MHKYSELEKYQVSQLGYSEGPRSNENKYAALAGHANFNSWCATFQVASFRHIGVKLGNESAYTPSLYASLKSAGLAIPGPKVGAVVFYVFPSEGRICHVGRIESLRPDGTFVAIEGNTNTAGSRSGGMVLRKVRAPHNTYFAMPKYDPEDAVAAPAVTKAKPNCEDIQKALHVTVDNDWGPSTGKAAFALRMATKFAGQKFTPDVKFVQEVVGAPQTGQWNAVSEQHLVNTIAAVQTALNKMGLHKGAPNGQWSAITDASFKKAHDLCASTH